MYRLKRTALWLPFIVLVMIAVGRPAFAQADLDGVWAGLTNEDKEARDPWYGEYAGVPLSEAGKMRANTWSASQWELPVWQCRNHPIGYWARSPHNLMVQKEINPTTRSIVAFHIQMQESQEAIIWMDGRPHPPANGLHTWNGFSTGEWIGDMLKVTTTHLKESYMRRNGVVYSDLATMTQYFMRRGDVLTWVQIFNDPVYLTEPFVRNSEFRMNGRGHLDTDECVTAQGAGGDVKRGEVPSYFPGENDALKEYSEQFESPYEANQGGAATMYPEFRERLRQMGGIRVPQKPFNNR